MPGIAARRKTFSASHHILTERQTRGEGKRDRKRDRGIVEDDRAVNWERVKG